MVEQHGWNQRSLDFCGEKANKVLWKDANLCKWEMFYKDLFNSIKSLKKQSLESHLAIVSRVLYKHQNQMRRDIPFQHFKRVRSLLQRLTKENLISKMSEYLHILVPIFGKKEKSFEKEVFLPSKEYTSYIFERILGCSKLSVQIIICCQKAFLLLDSHLRHGFFVSFNLFGIASVSRIWTVCLHYINNLKLVFITLKGILNECFEFKVMYPALDEWLRTDMINVVLPINRFKSKDEGGNILNELFGPPPKAHLEKLKIDENNDVEILGEPISWETFVKEKYGTTAETGEATLQRTIIKAEIIDGVKPLSRIRCPVCGKIIRKLKPSFCSKFRVAFRRAFFMSDVTRTLKAECRTKPTKTREALLAVKHALLHEKDLNYVKFLFMRYRQLRKRRRRL